MTRNIYLCATILLASGCTFNEKKQLLTLNDPTVRDPAYQPYNFWNPDGLGGYKDISISKKRWEIGANIWGTVEQHSTNIALYRIMLFAKYNGYSIVNVVSAKYYFVYPARIQNLTIVGIGANDTNEHPSCEVTGKFSQNCRTYVVDATLPQLQSALRMSDEDTKAEIGKISQKYPARPVN